MNVTPDPYDDNGYCVDAVHSQHWDTCVSGYRLTLAEARTFGAGGRWAIEHDGSSGGGVNFSPDSYTSTVFWYGVATANETVTDTLTLGDSSSESSHLYASAGSVAPFSDQYEDLTQPLDPTWLRTDYAAVSFRLAISPSNKGVVLRRTSDASQGYQRASVMIDGQPVGTWEQPVNNQTFRMFDDEFLLPPSATAGKSFIDVVLTPQTSTSPWTAVRYRAVSVL
jgi:hypothetical protein